MEPENDNLSSGLSLQEYLQILRRRRFIILQAFLLITIVGVIVTLLTKPVYQATGELLVDSGGMNVNNIDASNPIASLLAATAQLSPQTVMEELQTPQLQYLVRQAIGHQADFSLTNIKDTNVIQVTAEASSPTVAGNAVNELFKQYSSQDTDQSKIGLANSLEFVEAREADAQAALKKAQHDLQAFRKKNALIDFNANHNNKVGRVIELQNDYQSQQVQMAVLNAKINALQVAYAAQPLNNVYVLPFTNPRIQEMQAEIRSYKLQREALTQPGGLNPHGDAPILKQIDAEIATLQNQIASLPKLLDPKSSSPNGIRENLRGQLVDLRGSVTPLQTQMDKTGAELSQAKADAGKLPDLEATMEKLSSAVEAARTNEAQFSKEQSDLQLRQMAVRPSAHVIQPAVYTAAPVRPKKALNILFSCVIGLFVGLCLALLQEFLDDRINTVEDSDRLLALPSLGFVPALTGSDSHLLPQMQGTQAASESYRVLRTNVNFSSVDAPLRKLLVASSCPGEGKTTTAVNLAFAMVMDGKKVILLDTDLRRPSIHTMLGLPSSPGLTDVLAGQADLNDVLMQHSQVPGLMALTAGTAAPNPSELLNSRTFKALLEQLSEQADMVIMDSPPTLAAADAQILASQADGVVMVVEPGQTKKADAKQSLGLLRHARANVLGIAYNKMKSPTHGSYYYYQNTPPAQLSDGGKKGKAAKALPVAVETGKE
jgi:succinoglycan biosynthesis transport protein ExoP